MLWSDFGFLETRRLFLRRIESPELVMLDVFGLGAWIGVTHTEEDLLFENTEYCEVADGGVTGGGRQVSRDNEELNGVVLLLNIEDGCSKSSKDGNCKRTSAICKSLESTLSEDTSCWLSYMFWIIKVYLEWKLLITWITPKGSYFFDNTSVTLLNWIINMRAILLIWERAFSSRPERNAP